MTIPNQDTRPATVIEVIELHAPPQPVPDFSKPSGIRDIVEVVFPAIQVEGWCIVTEVRLHDALVAIVGVVGSGQSHACLHSAIFAVCNTYLLGNIRERAVMVIVVQNVGSGVGSDVNIGPSIIIKV